MCPDIRVPRHFTADQTHNLPRLAMVMCIKNEERFLEANLHYHHALGVARAYIYLDNCTDRSLELVQSFPWAVPILISQTQMCRAGYVNMAIPRSASLRAPRLWHPSYASGGLV